MTRILELARRLEKFRDDRNWKQFHNLKDLSIALSIEASELEELMLWKSNEDISKHLGEPKFLKSVKNECADILNYLILISKTVGFDLIDAALSKIEENEVKYPVEKSYGNAKKYRDLS